MNVASSIWGKVDYSYTLVDGVASRVHTAGHGGIVVNLSAVSLDRDVIANATDVTGNIASYEEDNDWGVIVLGCAEVREAVVASNKYFEKHDVFVCAMDAIFRHRKAFVEGLVARADFNTLDGMAIHRAYQTIFSEAA